MHILKQSATWGRRVVDRGRCDWQTRFVQVLKTYLSILVSSNISTVLILLEFLEKAKKRLVEDLGFHPEMFYEFDYSDLSSTLNGKRR
jgi:hypothetical protein